MRTTLDIEDDILRAAKELAAKENITTGAMISRLAKAGLQQPSGGTPSVRNGVPVFPSHGEIITAEHIKRLEEEGF